MKKLLLSIAMIISLSVQASADFVYTIQLGSASFSGGVGELFTSKLYAVESITTPSVSQFDSRTLNGAQFRIDVATPSVATITGFTRNAGLNDGGFVDIGGGGSFMEFQGSRLITPGVTVETINSSTRRFEIGTLSFSTVGVGTSAINISTISTRTSNGGPIGTTDLLLSNSPTPIGINLDSLPSGSSAVFSSSSITAVPEPTSMALVAVAGAGLAGWRLRRSRKKAQQA